MEYLNCSYPIIKLKNYLCINSYLSKELENYTTSFSHITHSIIYNRIKGAKFTVLKDFFTPLIERKKKGKGKNKRRKTNTEQSHKAWEPIQSTNASVHHYKRNTNRHIEQINTTDWIYHTRPPQQYIVSSKLRGPPSSKLWSQNKKLNNNKHSKTLQVMISSLHSPGDRSNRL